MQDTLGEGENISDLDERGRYELFAELRALKLHWPTRFAATWGACGEELMATLEPEICDLGKYLKLRRIALARLAGGGGTRGVDQPAKKNP